MTKKSFKIMMIIRDSSFTSLLKRWSRNASLLLRAIRTRQRRKEGKEEISRRKFKHLNSKIKVLLKSKKKFLTLFLKKLSKRKREIR